MMDGVGHLRSGQASRRVRISVQKPGLASRLLLLLIPQAEIAGEDNRLRSVFDTQFVENPRDVIAHGFLGKRQMRGDLRVVQTTREILQHITFARRKLG